MDIRTSRIRPALVALLTTASLLISACSLINPEEDPEPKTLEELAAQAESNGYEWQAEVLASGEITADDYDEAQRRTLACVTDHGLSYSEPQLVPEEDFRSDYEISWGDTDEEKGLKIIDECFIENLNYIEEAMYNWGDWQTAPELLEYIKTCLTERDYEINPEARNYRDVFIPAEDEEDVAIVEHCLNEGKLKLNYL